MMKTFIFALLAAAVLTGCGVQYSVPYDVYDSEVIDGQTVLYVIADNAHVKESITKISKQYYQCWSDITDYNGSDTYITIVCDK